MLKKLLKNLAALFLVSFIVSSSVEGRVHSHARPQVSSFKKTTTRNFAPTKNLSPQRKKQVVAQKSPPCPLVAKRPQARRTLIAKRPPPRKAAVTQKAPLKATPINKRQVVAKRTPSQVVGRDHPQVRQTNLQRKKVSPVKTAPNIRSRQAANSKLQYQHQQKTSLTQRRRPSQPAFKGSSRRQALLAKRTFANQTSANRKTPQKADYLSLLPFHTQSNAKAGGLDKLLAKDMKGQGQTVAVIELSGDWQQIKDVMNGKYGNLPPERKANYKSNFLTPIGGPGLHPEEMNDWIRNREHNGIDCPHHGSSVSSVILDLAPQTKVLPVSTYACYRSDQFYDVADALMDLSKRPDVGIINMSSGYTDFEINSISKKKQDGSEERLIKTIYRPKLVEAFKAVAKAGKVVVIAAGNQGIPIQVPEFVTSEENVRREDLFGHLMQELDSETRQSVILAGSYDPETRQIASYSNKPGSLKNAQEAFLFAPGKHLQQYDYMVGDGTSLAAPYICAVLSNLTSNLNISPRRAVQALKETAERRPDVRTYGRGIIRADKALELLERSY